MHGDAFWIYNSDELSDTAAPTKDTGIQAETSGLPGKTEKTS